MKMQSMYNKLAGQQVSVGVKSPNKSGKGAELRGRSQSNLEKNVRIYSNEMVDELNKI